jgi:hypothetical protein
LLHGLGAKRVNRLGNFRHSVQKGIKFFGSHGSPLIPKM